MWEIPQKEFDEIRDRHMVLYSGSDSRSLILRPLGNRIAVLDMATASPYSFYLKKKKVLRILTLETGG